MNIYYQSLGLFTCLSLTGTEEAPAWQNDIPLSLRLRAAVSTTLGAAAAHAKLLADQEDREVENLMATIVETQVGQVVYLCIVHIHFMMEKFPV